VTERQCHRIVVEVAVADRSLGHGVPARPRDSGVAEVP
jgi:hypothetical protein